MKPPFHVRHRTALLCAAAAVLALLAVVPRFINLGVKPLMHDESLFAYYSYQAYQTSLHNGPKDHPDEGHLAEAYAHMPILHGPALILLTAELFRHAGDSIAIGRTMIALFGLLALVCMAALWPRRARWWLVPLLLTSPILLFYSRFFRNEMLFTGVMMLGMLGVVQGLGAGRLRALWLAGGIALMLALLTIKENALFVYASAATFGVVYLALRLTLRRWAAGRRWLWTLRAGRRAPQPKPKPLPIPPPPRPAAAKRREAPPEAPATPQPMPWEAAEASAAATAPDGGVWAWSGWQTLLGWLTGALVGMALIAWVFGHLAGQASTVPPSSPTDGFFASSARTLGLLNLKASWDYWAGQHEEQRIGGPLHYHLPILLTYELPLLALIYIGIVWDATLRRNRALLQAAAMAAWLLVWWAWHAAGGPPFAGKDGGIITKGLNFLHLEPNGSVLTLGILIVPLLVWSLVQIIEHRRLGAWMGWFAACSLFQYSSAGEKVPWLSVHITVPFYLAVAWIWGPLLVRRARAAWWVFLIVALGGAWIGFRADLRFIGDDEANPRERLAYNHTTREFDRLVKRHLADWEAFDPANFPIEKRRVLLVDDPAWPGFWYFRHCVSPNTSVPGAEMGRPWDLIIGTDASMRTLLLGLDTSKWKIRAMSLRDHWWAPWPEQARWQAWNAGTPLKQGDVTDSFGTLLTASAGDLWRYWWDRTPWTEPGGFPIIVLDPLTMRQFPDDTTPAKP